MTHLKKCPKCKGKPRISKSSLYEIWNVWCPNNNCDSEIIEEATKQAAIEAWNLRQGKKND